MMSNLKVSLKLIVSFLIVIAMSVLIGVVGIVGMRSLEQSSEDLYNYNLIAVEAMGGLGKLFNLERNDIRNIFLNKEDPETVKRIISGFTEYDKTAAAYFEAYESTIQDESIEAEYYAAKEAYVGQYARMKTEMFAMMLEGRFDDAYALFTSSTAVIAPITNGLDGSAAMNNELALQSNQNNMSLYLTLTVVLIGVICVSIAVSLFLAVYISRLISRPLIVLTEFMNKAGATGDITMSQTDTENLKKFSVGKDEIAQCIRSTSTFIFRVGDIGDGLEKIAQGDLTAEISLLSDKDTIGLSMQKMVNNLNNMFGEINASTAQVSTGSKQIADGAQALAQGSTQQAAAVEQLSSSISEIANRTRENAEMADKAATLANSIMVSAEKGSRQMDEMMSAVKEINSASQSISKVIKVIDDIAFQTNILALNAAVEAARAGQHGKGFAVVAEEVRNLAAKSAEAAKDTGTLIANSMEKAEFGSKIAEETSVSLAEIVSGITESSQLVGEIAKSSEEQSDGISQINKGIDQVAQVVQQNSATAEQSAAASEEMNGQSNMLEDLVAQFKLRDGSSSGSSRQQKNSLAPAKDSKKQLVMPQKSSRSFDGGSDFGKY